MDRDTELAILHALKQGDEAAFDAVYEAYRARVFSFLLRLCRDRALAEELLEETWLRLVSRVHTLAEDSRVLPWLLTVARNLFSSHQRARSVDAHRIRELTIVYAARAPETSPFELTSAGELGQELERALATLPQHYQEALLLVGYEGLTPAEAAVVCEVTPEALRQRLSRARASLASKLEARGVEFKRTRWARNA